MIVPFLLAGMLLSNRAPLHRALWMWHGKPLLADGGARDRFFEFIQAPKGDPSHAISVIFLSEVDPSDASTASALGDVLQECHRRGIRVDYLCGEASWAEPNENAAGVGMVTRVLNYNASKSADRQFDGFQYDVEPYALKDWPTPALRSGFLRLFDSSREAIRNARSRIYLGAAIPRWFDAPELGGLEKDVLDRVDYVAVMDYVSTSANFVKDPINTVKYATQIGKQAWLGAEATELPTEPMATFYAKGNAALEDAFATADKVYSKDKGFAGVAVEYYETYVALRP
jgi:hypothetical protein